MKDRKDIQIVTFNVDDNVGMIEPLMKEKQYNFPVLLAKSVVDELVPSLSIPRNWVADLAANLRMESIGFGGDGEKWTAGVMEVLEKTK